MKRSDFAHELFRDRQGNPWKTRKYQRASLESWAERKVHCDGRDVGKTTEIEIVVCWAILHCPNSELLIATQTENHLYPLMARIARRIDSTPALAERVLEARRTPSWHFRFDTGFVLWGRIAGPRGMNFQGMHVDWQIVDEAQEMTEEAWGELYQALNGGGRRWVYGVPNGLRNGYFRLTELPPGECEQHRWPSWMNPEFTPAKHRELAALYGGPDSPGYLHRVLGLHGEPLHAVFPLEDYLACVNESLPVRSMVLRQDQPLTLPDDLAPGCYYLGCDLGFARDPSEFVVYRNEPPHLIHALRLRLEGVQYQRQAEIIRALDAACGFRMIGIDAGNNGRAVAHILQAESRELCVRVKAYEFGANMDLPPRADGTVPKRRTKEFMTELLRTRLAERTIVFPRLPDRESQYASHTYHINRAEQVIYEKGNDHLIDADRCAVLAHFHDTEMPVRPDYDPGCPVYVV